MNLRLIHGCIVLAFALSSADAQTSAPVVVPAVPPPNMPVAVQHAPVQPNAQTTVQALQLLKATNDEILKKQTATLQQLEEIEKAAAQIKIYSKRG